MERRSRLGGVAGNPFLQLHIRINGRNESCPALARDPPYRVASIQKVRLSSRTQGIPINNLKWHLFTIRTQIEMRMSQLNVSQKVRQKVIEIISKVTDVPLLTALARRLETKRFRVPAEGTLEAPLNEK
jgi:hypothetical protein